MGQAELVRRGVFTPEQVDEILVLLVRKGGNVKRTAEELQAQGVELSKDSLRRWKDTYAERYVELATQFAKESKDQAVSHGFREQVYEQQDLMARLRGKLGDDLDAIDPKEIPGAIQKLTVASGIATQNMLLLEGRPTEIRETRNPDWYEQKLRELATELQNTVNGSVEEEMASDSELPGGPAT